MGEDCTCLLLHVTHAGVPPLLKKVLESSKIYKAGLNIIGDAAKIKADYGVRHMSCMIVRLPDCHYTSLDRSTFRELSYVTIQMKLPIIVASESSLKGHFT
jgi:predicted metal-binding protein